MICPFAGSEEAVAVAHCTTHDVVWIIGTRPVALLAADDSTVPFFYANAAV